MDEREPIGELDFERYGQWVRAEHPDKGVIEGHLEIPCHFGDCYARRLHALDGKTYAPHTLQERGYVFYRIEEPNQGAYERGYKDGLTAARDLLDKHLRS